MQWGVVALLVGGVAIQLVPYGRNHTNPAGTREPTWDSPQTRELAVKACYDCHSNQTVWPWYSNVAPVSWLIQRDVDKGRHELNLTDWDASSRRAREAGEEVQRGRMPPFYYTMMHPEAVLSAQDREALARGLQASLGGRR